MKYKIRYRKYDESALVESVSVIEAWFLKLKTDLLASGLSATKPKFLIVI